MLPIKLSFTILLILIGFLAKASYGSENYVKTNSGLKLAQSPYSEGFNDGQPINREGKSARLHRWNFEQDGRPEPGNRDGGASRGNCPPIESSLTALVPQTNLGLTTEEYPTFWFHIPYSVAEIAQAELMVLDENQQPALEQALEIELSQTPGIVGIKLPSTAQPLAVGQKYRWYLELICNTEDPSANPSVNGWVKRVQPSSELITQLESYPAQQRYLAYAENGIWYDALTHLISQMEQSQFPRSLRQDWSDLLTAVGLQDLVQVPTTDCCQPTSP